MLDPVVVDLACSLDDRQLLRDGQLRGYYKDAVRGFLPAEIINKSKHGFGLPFGVWLREDASLKMLAHEALGQLSRRHLFRPEFITDALRLHGAESAGYWGELVWVMLLLELWFQAHGF